MRKIIYYVASSVDGFISGVDDAVSGFVHEGNGVDTYLNDLKAFDTVIMGRSTYEFGYKFGVQPGQPSPVYAHMAHYIFSDSLAFDTSSEQVQVKKVQLAEIETIRAMAGTDIYLCGGGQFAGWLLDHQQINTLKLKLNPLLLGAGVKLFGDSKKEYTLQLVESERYDKGLQIMTFDILY